MNETKPDLPDFAKALGWDLNACQRAYLETLRGLSPAEWRRLHLQDMLPPPPEGLEIDPRTGELRPIKKGPRT